MRKLFKGGKCSRAETIWGNMVVHFLDCEMIIIKWTHCVWMHLLSRLQCDIHFHITIGICFCLISFHSSRAGKKEKNQFSSNIKPYDRYYEWAHSDFFSTVELFNTCFHKKKSNTYFVILIKMRRHWKYFLIFSI